MSDVSRINELADQMVSLRSDIEELAAIEEPTQEQSERFDTLANDYEGVEAEYNRLSERAKRADRARAILEAEKPEKVERGFHAPNVVTKKDPFENPEGIRAGHFDPNDLIGRAREVIDTDRIMPSDASREQAYRMAETPGVARHMLLTGSPAYRSAFQKWMRNPQYGHQMWSPAEQEAMRAAMSNTVGNGGYLIPQQLDPTIILTSDGSTNPFRQISRVEQGFSNQWEGVTSAGVTAEWLAEATEAADASPTVAAPTIAAHKAAAYVFGSFEVFGDTNIETQLPGLLVDAKDQLEADAFAIGSGSGAPKGVVTAVTAVTASRVAPTTGGTFGASSEVYKVINAVPPRHRSRASWIANYATYNVIRQFDTGGGGGFWANLGPDTPDQLIGRPVYESSKMVSAITTGSNILLAGNFNDYLIYDRVGMTLAYEPLVKGDNGRPTGQSGYLAYWRVGGDVTNANAFRVLKL